MNILIVKLSSLGDVVQTLPVVADLLAAHPDARIDWVVEEAFAPLVARVVGIRRVVPVALRRWRRSWFSRTTRDERRRFRAVLRTTSYDVVIDCQGLIKSALIARTARLAPRGLRGSFANKSDACSYEWPVRFLLPNNQVMPTRMHAVARTRLLAAKLLGYAPQHDTSQDAARVAFSGLPARATTLVPALAPTQRIMFAHGTTRMDNEWSVPNWCQLAHKLQEQQACTFVLPHASVREQAVCEAVKAQLGDCAEILPRMDLAQLLDAMAACDGVIGVDSGLSHLAVALGLPHVQIFSQDRAWRAGPLPVGQGGVPHQVAIGGTFVPSPEQVHQAWLGLTKD